MAPVAIARWSTTRSSSVSRRFLASVAQHTDYNSRIGLQAGAATTVFDFRDLCGRVQYHGFGSVDRVHDCVFPSSWSCRDGLGSLFSFVSSLSDALIVIGMVHREYPHLLCRSCDGMSLMSSTAIAHHINNSRRIWRPRCLRPAVYTGGHIISRVRSTRTRSASWSDIVIPLG
jgi:hypothetical protein